MNKKTTSFSVEEARYIVRKDKHLDEYYKQMITYLCNRIRTLEHKIRSTKPTCYYSESDLTPE